MPPVTLAMAICLTACAVLLSTSVGIDEQGKVMGTNMSLQTGAEAVSGLLAGIMAVVAVKLPPLATSWAAVLGALILLRWWPAASARLAAPGSPWSNRRARISPREGML